MDRTPVAPSIWPNNSWRSIRNLPHKPVQSSRRNSMSKIIDRLASVTKILAGICLGIMTLMIGILILGRYLGLSVPWADELARIFFVWTSLLGASSGTHKRLHFSVSFFTNYLQEPIRRKLDFVISLLVIGMMLFILFVGWDSLKIAGIQIYPGLQISKIWMNLPIVISSLLITLFMVEHLRVKFLMKSK
jgi:TRAP-type C4-dicarboxylate transport system permease small subunit